MRVGEKWGSCGVAGKRVGTLEAMGVGGARKGLEHSQGQLGVGVKA